MRSFKASSKILNIGLITVSIILLLAVCVGFGAYSCSTTSKLHENQDASVESVGGADGLGEDNLINLQQTPDSSFLYDIAIADLCSADVSYQKRMVQVKGEVIGHPVDSEQNPGMHWITLRSEPGEKEDSLSILLDESHLDAIDSYGDYNMRGTILSVKGTFHVACTSHEGIMDIHAENVSAVQAGYKMPDDFNIVLFAPGLLLILVAVGLYFAYRSFAEGER